MPHDLFGAFQSSGAQAQLGPEPHPDEMEALFQRLASVYAQIGEKAFPEVCSLPAYAELTAEVNEVNGRIEALKAERERLEKELAQRNARFTCPNCRKANAEGARFCEECGAKLAEKPASACPGCGAENPPGMKFCPECGAKLGEKPASACPTCGAENPPGTKFCAECGAKQGA